MRKYLYIGFLLSVLLSACRTPDVQKEQNERFAINELLLLRTEGFALVELAHTYVDNQEISAMCQRIMAYYKDTHPDFVKLCQGKQIAVGEQDFELLWNKIIDFLENNEQGLEGAFLDLCQDNILRSIALYEIIIQRNDWEDMSYFSFRALPDLYNQQGDLRILSRRVRNAPLNHVSDR